MDDDEVFWSPADWAWTGGLMDALLPTLYFAAAIVAFQGPLLTRACVRADAAPRGDAQFPVPHRAEGDDEGRDHAACALPAAAACSDERGEAVGDAVFHWCEQALGVTVNEMFGQTEINYIVGNCGAYVDAAGRRRAAWPARPGSMGAPIRGTAWR